MRKTNKREYEEKFNIKKKKRNERVRENECGRT